MTKTIDEIRTLLDRLEGELPSDDDAAFSVSSAGDMVDC